MLGRLRRFAEPEQHIGRGDQRMRALDPDSLNPIIRFVEAGSIGDQDGNTAERQRHVDMVARGPWYVGNDRSLATSYRVDKA